MASICDNKVYQQNFVQIVPFNPTNHIFSQFFKTDANNIENVFNYITTKSEVVHYMSNRMVLKKKKLMCIIHNQLMGITGE